MEDIIITIYYYHQLWSNYNEEDYNYIIIKEEGADLIPIITC